MSENNNSSSRRRTATNTGTARRSTTGSSAGSRSTGNRNHSSGMSSHSGGTAQRRKKKKKPDITMILMYGIGAVILILCIGLAVKGCGKLAGAGKESTEASETETSTGESGSQVTVDGIDITGMTRDQAKAAILKQYDWDMKVTYKDKEAAVSNLMDAKVNELLEEIYASEKKASYEISTDNMIEPAKAEAALIAGNWNMAAKNGGISGYDKSTGKFTFTQGSNGVVIDQERLAADIVASIQKKDYKAVVTAATKEIVPDMTADQLKAKYKTIGTYSTKTTSNKDRNENIRLSAEALNGIIVNPGQEFSFNNATGARSLEKGYKPATAYLNGEIIQEPGGGVCQLSSTLYNAVIFSGLKSTERHAHSYEPSYVIPGEDAMVSFGGPDFKFVNNSDFPIAIKTSFANQELTTSIYGVQIVEDGVKISMDSSKTSALDPPPPVYEEDQTLQLDEEKVTKQPVPGSRWTTYLVVKKDGNEVSRELFHNSSYRGKASIIKRNTSGVVVTTEAPTTAPVEPASTEVQPPTEPSAPAGPGAEGPGQVTNPNPTPPSSPVTPEVPVSPGMETTPAAMSPGGVSPGNPGASEPGPM